MIKFFRNAWNWLKQLINDDEPIITRPLEPIEPVKPEPKKTINSRILEVAESLKDKVREYPGDSHNPVIVEMFKIVTGKPYPDETPWCAVAVGYVLSKVGLEHTGSMLARSYVDYGKEVNPADVRKGDIVVFKRGNSNWQGHVGFFYGFNKPGVYSVLGGNQSNAFNVSDYKIEDLLSIRRPEEEKEVPEYRLRANHFTNANLTNKFWDSLFESSKELSNLRPRDIEEYFPNYDLVDFEVRADFWRFFLSCMAKKESNVNPRATFKESFRVTYGPRKGQRVLSSGLFQISIDSVNGYVKHGGIKINSQDELFSDWINLEASVFILSYWIKKDGVIYDYAPFRGGSRYWSVLRDNKNHDWIRSQCLQNFTI